MAIYQEHLDTMTAALLAGEFDTFERRVSYPLTVRTLSNDFIVEARPKCECMFRDMHSCLHADGITEIIRIATSARFVTPDEIIGSHESHKMRGAVRATPPYENHVRLARGEDGLWRATHCANAVENKAGKFAISAPPARWAKAPDLFTSSERNPE
jgi:hypothetical protein